MQPSRPDCAAHEDADVTLRVEDRPAYPISLTNVTVDASGEIRRGDSYEIVDTVSASGTSWYILWGLNP
jgi:hypothetical protein